MRVHFLSEDLKLEGLLTEGVHEKGVVVTHPHPLYGGDMYNPVVEAVADAYRKKGYTTLRFNFRGTGNSQGRYDDGRGEQKDVLAALSHLKGTGIRQVELAGYSFGAWINARVGCPDRAIERMIMVSPPVAFISFSDVGSLPCLKLVVTGSLDDIAPSDRIESLLPEWNSAAEFEIIVRADHFYSGRLGVLSRKLSLFL